MVGWGMRVPDVGVGAESTSTLLVYYSTSIIQHISNNLYYDHFIMTFDQDDTYHKNYISYIY